MRIVHKVPRSVGDSIVSDVVLYEFAQEPNDFWQHIHDAIMDYCATPEGRQRVADGQMATYDDFLAYVPNEICQKHGFDRVIASAEAIHCDSQLRIVNTRSMAHFLHQLDQAQEREEAIHRTIPQLAKAMADMHSQTPRTDKWSIWQIANTSIKWSVEFVESGESDLRGFVRRKLDELGTPKPTKKNNAPA